MSYWRWVRTFQELFEGLAIKLPWSTRAIVEHGWAAGLLALATLGLLRSRERPSLLIPLGLAFAWTSVVALTLGLPALHLARALGR